MNIDKREHLISILKDFDVAMLVTKTDTGYLRSRPMGLASVTDDGVVLLSAQVTSDKVAQIQVNPQVALTAQSKAKFASLSGRAAINRDRSLIDQLWKETWRVWFPEGKDDPDLCLIEFHPSEGEYWDERGALGAKFIVDAAKAYLSGEEITTPPEANGRVFLP